MTILPSGGFVALDTALDDDLVAEGLVRDVVRVVQQARRDAGLDVGDRVLVRITAPDAVWAAVDARVEYLRSETLAIEVTRVDDTGATSGTVGDGVAVSVSVTRA